MGRAPGAPFAGEDCLFFPAAARAAALSLIVWRERL
jgi:hypothetical protein